MSVRLPLLAALAVAAAALAPFPAAAEPVMYPSGVGADLGATPTTLGIQAHAGDNAEGLQTGTNYWKTNYAADTRYFLFDLDQEYVDGLADDDVSVSVTYLDTGTGELAMQYDTGSDPQPSATLALGDTGQWKTGTFYLTGVRFGNGINGADLELGLADPAAAQDITVSSIRVSTAGARVDFGAVPRQDRISVRAGDQAEGLVTGTLDGRSYWQSNRTSPAPSTLYFYLNVDDTFLYDNRNRVLISVDYFDEGNGSFLLQYDSPGEELGDKFKNSPVFAYGDTKTWKTHTFGLDDAILTNRSNGSDLRIALGGSPVEMKVAAVKVAVVAAELDVKQGLRALAGDASRTLRTAREGDRDGQYPVGSKATLAGAIDSAQGVLDDPDAPEAEVKMALHDLYDTLQAFLDKVVDTNLTGDATATASSSASGSPAGQAIDGDDNTAWTSAAGAGGEWLLIDLGRAQPVNEVRVAWGAGYSPDYTIELSEDGSAYSAAGRWGATGGGSTSRTRFATTTARYVRLVAHGYGEGSDSFSVRELEIRNLRIVPPRPALVKTAFPTEDAVVADYNVLDYGADRTGRQDSTKAIQRAIYDCYDAGGGTVWLPAGTYKVSDTIEVHAFCTVRGDRRDPDAGSGGYGTVVVADLPPGADGPALFRIGGSAGVMGVTTYYPRQSATEPVPYNFTFEIPGGAWIGTENYMMATVSDVTMLNSYKGIGISTMPSDGGAAPSSGQVHESSTIRNVKGTALLEGARAYNGADVGTWENVTFSNAYWASAPKEFRPPARPALDAWTRANGTAFALGDLEWEQLYRLSAADYKVGIHIVPGQRISFAGSFLQTEIRRTDVALKVENFDSRWGLVFSGGVLEGSTHAIDNGSEGFVKVTGAKLIGDTAGRVPILAGTPPTYEQRPLPKPARAVLYDATKAPFNAPRGTAYLPVQDATQAVQRALDQAGADGGGIVYLPAGWYRISTHLRIPANVELRGASAVPNRDQLGASGGTVLMAFEGRGTTNPESATALLTLAGNRAGVRGLRVFYPENNPAAAEGLVPYPYAVRGDGNETYVVNAGMPNAWNGVDFATHANDGFVVRKLTGAFFNHTVHVGASDRGRIEGLLSNGNAIARVGYLRPNWVAERDIFPQVIDTYMRTRSELVTVDGASRLTVLNAFGYGFHEGLVVQSGEVTAYDFGTDNLGADGHTVQVGSGQVTVTNLLRYNGTTSSGPARLYNIMAINLVQHAVTTAVAPAGAGTVALTGNETEPGRYEHGSQVTATARAARGYTFVNWTANGTVVATSPALTVTVDADLDLRANFTTAGS
ncbi:glycosyl hydrolase family 28-related protein [Flindersiella endophytica]